ncbi:MAG: family 1 glycosylhydrolase [Myxococcales bacterium]
MARRWTPWIALLACAAAACQNGPQPSSTKLPVSFPKGFRLGFATIAYQSEGDVTADGGRVDSNWSEWEDMGNVAGGQKNQFGNGFYQSYDVDLGLAAGIGANAFSYSLDWAKIEPQEGVFDDAEAAHAVAVVSDIRKHGMRPMIILFHWETPAWVQSPETGVDMLASTDQSFVNAFLPFVDYMVPKLAAQVDDWVTFEEPLSIILGEYVSGEHPPGKLLDIPDATNAWKNLMYLNARTYQHVHQDDTVDADGDGIAAWVGMENLAIDIEPLDPGNPDDVAAAKHVDYIANQDFINAVTKGDIDLAMKGRPQSNDPTLANTLDFIGLNYYQVLRVEGGGIFGSLDPIDATPFYDVRQYDPLAPHGDDYLEISAAGLRKEIEAYASYHLPLMVTENGMADADDDQRPFYTLQHIYQIGNAIRDGFDVRGYFHWTISDNFEWAYGLDLKEGVFQVDFGDPSLPRTPTHTSVLFSKIAAANGIDTDIWGQFGLATYPVGIP